MKKIGKKWGSLLLAGLLLAASLPIGALAQEPAGEEPASQEEMCIRDSCLAVSNQEEAVAVSPPSPHTVTVHW